MLMRNSRASRLTNSSLALLLTLAGCSWFKGKNNERKEGHHELYSEPHTPDIGSLGPTQRRVVIVATSDWQGHLEPKTVVARDHHQPQEILLNVGGVETLARYLNILRTHYPQQVLALDAGNALAGGAESRYSSAKAIFAAFAELRYDALNLSSADLAAGPLLKTGTTAVAKWLPETLKKTTTPVVLGNLVDLHTATPVSWGPTQPQIIKEVNGVKVGVVGLLGDDAPKRLDPGLMNGLYVEPSLQALLKHTRSLRLKGAEVIVLMVHGGVACGEEKAKEHKLPLNKVNFNPNDAKACADDAELARFLQSLPPGLVDVVATGGAASKVANVVAGIPVVQAFAHGVAFSRVDLIYDKVKGKVLTDETVIHQPVLLCQRFFKETSDCYAEDTTVDHRELVPARYLGVEITPDPKVSEWLAPWRDLFATEANKIVLRHSESKHDLRSSLAHELRRIVGSDAALIGGEDWALNFRPGVVSQRELWRLKDARAKLHIFSLSGTDLAKLRSYLTGDEVAWDLDGPLEELTLREQVTLAMPAGALERQMQRLLTDLDINAESVLAPQVMADVIASPESDLVTSLVSGPRRKDE